MTSSILVFCLFCIYAPMHGNFMSSYLKKFREKTPSEAFEQERIQLGDPVGPSDFAGALIFFLDGKYGGPFCASSLISIDSALTAAHCFLPELASSRVKLYVVFGLSDLREPSLIANANNPNVNIIAFDYPSDVLLHESYVGDGDWFQHDIAIIKLRRPVETRSVKPVKLAKNKYLKGIYAVGWGRKNCTHASVETLRRAKAQVTTNEQCSSVWMGARSGVPIYDSQMCAYFATANQQRAAVSAGDSGGPLFKAGPGEKIQIGVLSHVLYYIWNYYELGWRCTNPSFPQIFTRVSSYEMWIKDRVPQAEFV
ncbi:unnamed protein product [Allacma fusca]|uniref:Peptidase S1 domain-containing protein n=1 Tax=Allacma fusca TaxID=39272 RepID=A0A8J2NL69_9HEXA|nr:unnamed protein product [Allacma fusca]